LILTCAAQPCALCGKDDTPTTEQQTENALLSDCLTDYKVWNLIDGEGAYCGQAAMFGVWRMLA